jgi:hypothetical protein
MLLAQRTAYCLRVIELIEPAGKRGRAPLHRRTRLSPRGRRRARDPPRA